MRNSSAYQKHPGLQWLRSSDAGQAWLSALPGLVEECAQRWSLSLGEPFRYAYTSLVLPVTRGDGTPAALKVQFPDRESEHEASALIHWNGNGAIRLLDRDPECRALLLERCLPGTTLSRVDPQEALRVFVGLLARLSTPAGPPFRSLAEEAVGWADSLLKSWDRAGRPFERPLVDTALDYLTFLPESQGEQVLIHQDLHADNVLRADREPWLAIDPKPLVGERELSVAPIVRGPELGHSRELVLRRLELLVNELGLDRERARGWTIIQTLAWAFEDNKALPQHVQTARWLVSSR